MSRTENSKSAWITRFRRLAWVPEGTRPSDLLLPGLFLLLPVGLGWVSIRALENQRADGILVDLSGRQRMNCQRALREAYGRSAAGLESAIQALGSNAALLRDGGTYVPDEGVRPVSVPSAKDPQLIAKLDEQAAWAAELEELVKPMQAGENGLWMERILDLTGRIQESAESVVKIYVRNSNEKILATLVMSLFSVALLTVFGLLVIRMTVERKYRMREVERARDQAVQASEAKSTFLANMSHEIRTPLNAVIGMADLLQHTELTGEQRRLVDTLRRAGDTLLALISDVLDMAKIESGQIELNRESFDLGELIDRLGEIMAFRAHQKGIELLSFVGSDVPQFVMGDSHRLRQVLMNLLGNALKFTSAGEVSLRVELESASESAVVIRFAVSDTGIGIPAARLRSIFEKFSQGSPSIAVQYGGTGLGLAISRQLVHLMGGEIQVKSQVGAGSTFSFLARFEPAAARMVGTSAPDGTLAGKRVLIVDDNETNRFIVRSYLSGLGLTMDEAANGAQALERLRKARAAGVTYDAVLLDHRMPGMSGLGVAQRARAEHLVRNSLLMVLTSDGRKGDFAQAAHAGISGFMIKPIRRTELVDAVKRALSGAAAKAAEEAPAQAGDVTQARANGGGKLKVLVVDDVEDNRFVVSGFLKDLPVTLIEADSGQAAVEKYKEGGYGLVLMDLRMSPMDGYAATGKIRKWESDQGLPRTPVIALTAYAIAEELERAKAAGCDDYVTKPVSRERLLDAIGRAAPGFLAPPPGPALALVSASTGASPTNAVGAPVHVKLDDFMKPRFEAFLGRKKADIPLILDAISRQDFETIATLGHNISGTAGMYGLTELGQMGHRLEKSAERRDTTEVEALCSSIDDYLQRVVCPS